MHSSEVAREFVYPQGHLLLSLAHNTDFGRIGVTIFFLISGYLIPSSLGERHAHGGREFWIKRFFRLYPAYWISVLTGYIGCWVVVGRQFDVSALWANLLMFQEYLGFKSVQGLYWTLHTELVFYLLTFLLYLGGWNTKGKVLAGVSMLFLAAFLCEIGFELAGRLEKADLAHKVGMTMLHLSIMYWGALFRSLMEGRGRNPAKLLGAATVMPTLFALLFLFGLGRVAHGEVPADSDFIRLALAYPMGFMAFVLVVLLGAGSLRRLRWAGDISYSLYLFHPALIYPIALAFGHTGIASVLPPDIGGLVIVASCFTVAIAVAFAMYRWVERPAMSLGKTLASSISGKSRDVRARA